MKKIIEIFKTDMKKVWKRKIAVIILIGLLFIPGIYAWLNIDSNWNPYGNTGNLPIAVVNKDQGLTILNEDINMGSLLVDSLKSNTAMKWIFTDEEDAKTNVDKGKYYGVIILPEDFTSKIATLFDGTEIVKPQFDFYVNQKKNPIAPIIVNKAIGTIENNLDQAFVNAIVYKVMDTAEDANVVAEGTATTTDVITKLKNTNKSIEQLRATLNTISLASDSAGNALNAVKDLLPTVSNISTTSSKNISNMKDIIKSFNGVYTDVNNNIGLIIDAAATISSNVNNVIQSGKIKENKEYLLNALNSLSSVLSQLNSIIDSLNGTQGVTLDKLKELTQQALDDVNKMIEDLNKMDESSLADLKAKSAELNQKIQNIKTQYNNTVKLALNKAFSNASTSMSNIANTISTLDTALGKSDTALASTIKALDSTGKLTTNIDTVLVSLEDDINKIISKLGGATQSELYLKILNLLENKPNDVADFISTPIATNEIDLYEINSYGSKMAPFYTVLASWVGCTLLVSIVKTDIKKDKKLGEIKPYQAFFGRFMTFGILAILQGLVIGVGDIIMGVQVVNYPLFLLTIMLTSLVFMLIVYSLTISFGKVGEATAVVIMVLQVAGSGGTFPIELLPGFFQKLQPIMPFYPAMNALRETIGGFYGNNYIMYIGALLLHTIIPLLIGLVFRRPIIKFKQELSEKLEETDLIV